MSVQEGAAGNMRRRGRTRGEERKGMEREKRAERIGAINIMLTEPRRSIQRKSMVRPRKLPSSSMREYRTLQDAC